MKGPNSSTLPSITCIRNRFDFVGATLAASGARTRLRLLRDASRVDADPRSQASNFECAKPIPFFTYYTTVNEGGGIGGNYSQRKHGGWDIQSKTQQERTSQREHSQGKQ